MQTGLESNINATKLPELLQDEIELLRSMLSHSVCVHQSLLNRDWETLENGLEAIRDDSTALNEYERQRIDLAIEIAKELNVKPHLRTIASALPQEQRSVLLEQRRCIKAFSSRIASVVQNLSDYLQATSSTIQGVMSELFPGRQAYNAKGESVTKEDTAYLVDHKQ